MALSNFEYGLAKHLLSRLKGKNTDEKIGALSAMVVDMFEEVKHSQANTVVLDIPAFLAILSLGEVGLLRIIQHYESFKDN